MSLPDLSSFYEPLIESGYVPDTVLRVGIRRLLASRSKSLQFGVDQGDEYKTAYFKQLRDMKDIAINTKEANEQHYEVPTEFFRKCLGPRLKYSCCLFDKGAKTLGEAEEHMLDLYVQRSGIKDGMKVLDVGCGWGSLTLYLAEKFPNCDITSISNSKTQKEYIMSVCEKNGWKHVNVITADMNEFNFDKQVSFDRIFSIEMFEHMKNYRALLDKISTWLEPEEGRLFVHVFCHKEMPYSFETSDPNSWMAKYFFTGGTMPSQDLFMWFQDNVTVVDRWTVDGRNYGETSEQWLKLMDEHRIDILRYFTSAYGEKDAALWFYRWRIFYLAVAETFNYNKGQEWCVVHYLFKKN
ncbi:S-adenosyl-L-methionine-dependent methyltransferase [Gorgonomyces haynaldii]|nr:S-adenosyl-L-methionine-dependent methyltransferase [Gorgonomyces haynaldii]